MLTHVAKKVKANKKNKEHDESLEYWFSYTYILSKMHSKMIMLCSQRLPLFLHQKNQLCQNKKKSLGRQLTPSGTLLQAQKSSKTVQLIFLYKSACNRWKSFRRNFSVGWETKSTKQCSHFDPSFQTQMKSKSLNMT